MHELKRLSAIMSPMRHNTPADLAVVLLRTCTAAAAAPAA
jgi:hypothetical protein